ncbi:hypothetical protein J7K44_02025 [bacterium]|nr:hypothetical protein [bacterium]
MKKISLIFLLTSLLLPFTQVLAAGLVPCGGKGEAPCQLCHFFLMFDCIVRFVLFRIIPPLATLMLVFGGAKFLLASENPQQAEQGKKIITTVVIGLIIIYGAWLLIGMFFSIIGVAEWTGLKSWYQLDIPCPHPGWNCPY